MPFIDRPEVHFGAPPPPDLLRKVFIPFDLGLYQERKVLILLGLHAKYSFQWFMHEDRKAPETASGAFSYLT
jgi:hypothetical protein